MPYVKGVDRNQTTLFPESIEDYITSDNQVRVIDAYVEQLDMVALNFNFAKCPGVGRPPYNPKVLLKLYLYGCLNRVRSSRRLEHEAKRNVELLWLLEKQALLNCSRQAGKSTVAAILALHESLYAPNSVTVLVSPSQRQSSELFRKVVEFREQLPFQPDLLEDNRLSMHVRGGGRVLSLPGSEATIRGISAVTLLIEDEAARVDDALYRAVRPMLAIRNGKLVLMSTPFGKRGHFYQEWTDGGPGWSRVRVPATEVPRISPGFLEEERNALGDWWYRQEYLCDFVEAEDVFFRDDDVASAITSDVRPLFPIGANP